MKQHHETSNEEAQKPRSWFWLAAIVLSLLALGAAAWQYVQISEISSRLQTGVVGELAFNRIGESYEQMMQRMHPDASGAAVPSQKQVGGC